MVDFAEIVVFILETITFYHNYFERMVALKIHFRTWAKSLTLMFFTVNLCAQPSPADSARFFLINQLDRCHVVSFVYLNGNDACNIFIPHGEGDVDRFTTITQQYREDPEAWQSHGLLIYQSEPDTNGYAAWAYTWGVDNFGQFPGIDMSGADSLVFYLKGKGTVEVIVGGTNRPPFKSSNPAFIYEDGVDARSTGYIELQDTFRRYVLNLTDDRFWVFKSPTAGANNKYPQWGRYEDAFDCSEYLYVSLDSMDETGEDCIAVTWMRPASVTNNPPNNNCYGGFGLLSPNISINGDWALKTAQGYNLLGLDSICFMAKMTKPGKIEVNFNSNDCPGGKDTASFMIDTIWRKYCWDIQNNIYYKRTNLGFGVALKKFNQGLFTPDSVTLFLDSIYYVGVHLKSKFDSLITGFKIVASAKENPNTAIIHFDSIFFNRARLDEPRFPQSFVMPNTDTIFLSQQMTAHTYDASLAIIALLAQYYKDNNNVNFRTHAEKIGDAFLYAMSHDRYYKDGRLRNVYAAGLNNYLDTARMAGHWREDSSTWYEDRYDVSTATGNIAWAALALISLYEATNSIKYLDAAEHLAQWVIDSTWDDRGFNAGYEGWEDSISVLQYTATEHCIDLYAVFTRLYNITDNEAYVDAAIHADSFVQSMWDAVNGKFFTGTLFDGTGINTSVIPTDLQPWYLLAYNERDSDFTRGYYWAKDSTYLDNHTHPGDTHFYKGFDFSLDQTDSLDGIGYEFTGQMTTCACWLGDTAFYHEMLEEIEYIQANGPGNNGKGIIAACHDHLTTGFNWEYHNVLHTGGATCWYLFAKDRINPYYNPNVQFDCRVVDAVKEQNDNIAHVVISPNPSAGAVTVSFSVASAQRLTIEVLDMSGIKVKSLSNNQIFQTGGYQLRFDGQDLPNGLYLLSVRSPEGQVVKKMAIVN